jgi:hypothetical protein
MSEPLSPAAQAVASAYDDTPEKDTGNHRYLWLAAALRAAADQVEQRWRGFSHEACQEIRAIAAELEAAND